MKENNRKTTISLVQILPFYKTDNEKVCQIATNDGTIFSRTTAYDMIKNPYKCIIYLHLLHFSTALRSMRTLALAQHVSSYIGIINSS